MISSTLGAPFGGTIRAGQYGFEPPVVRSILPPNFCGGGGNLLAMDRRRGSRASPACQ